MAGIVMVAALGLILTMQLTLVSGEREECTIDRVVTIVDSALIPTEDQLHLRRFLMTTREQLFYHTFGYRSSTITTNHASRFIPSSRYMERTVAEGINRALQIIPLPLQQIIPSPLNQNFILIITDWKGNIAASWMPPKAVLVLYPTIVVVAVGVTEPTRRREVLHMVGGRQSRVIFVEEYRGLEDKINETIAMICPGVPTICGVRLGNEEEGLTLNIACRSPDVLRTTGRTEPPTDVLQMVTDNLLRCWLNSRFKERFTVDIHMRMCERDARWLHHNCSISTTDLDLAQYRTVISLGRLEDDCIDPISEFYRKVNDYHTPCPANTTYEIVVLLSRINITQVDWNEIHSLAILCLLPEEYCTANVDLANRVADLMEDSAEVAFFNNLKSEDQCCNWEDGCRDLYLNSTLPAPKKENINPPFAANSTLRPNATTTAGGGGGSAVPAYVYPVIVGILLLILVAIAVYGRWRKRRLDKGDSSGATQTAGQTYSIWDENNMNERKLLKCTALHKKLTSKYDELVENVRLDNLWPKFKRYNVVNTLTEQRIKAERTPGDMVYKLLEILGSSPSWRFHAFLKTLCEDNQEACITLLGLDVATYKGTSNQDGNDLVHYVPSQPAQVII